MDAAPTDSPALACLTRAVSEDETAGEGGESAESYELEKEKLDDDGVMETSDVGAE